MDALAAKVSPAAALAGVSRDDIRNTLHTHFRSRPAGAGGRGDARAVTRKQRVFAFVQVQKRKAALGLGVGPKRLFATGGGVPKQYILCVTAQDGGAGAAPSAQLHYVQFLRSLAVDVRQSWDIARLDVIENHGLTTDKKRGAFALLFEGEDQPWQWLVHDAEPATAMAEFLWSLCALAVDQKKPMPRLTRFNVEELHETAIRLNLPKKYGVDVDLLDHLAAMKKLVVADGDDNQLETNPATDSVSGKADGTDKRGAAGGASVAGLRLTDAENADADVLLANVNWADAHLGSIEDNLRKKLRALEDDNITFLLSFEGHQPPVVTPDSRGNQTATAKNSGGAPTTAVDRIVAAIDELQRRVVQAQGWTDESDEFLQQTSANMMHFEALNNQLEVHFRNTVALQDVLDGMIHLVEIPREQMGVLLKPVSIFPDDSGGGGDASQSPSAGMSATAQRELDEQLRATLTMLARVDDAIKSTHTFPASEMAAFRGRGDELTKLAKAYTDKLCVAFDAFLQRRTRQWALASMAQAASRAGTPTRARTASSAMRDQRDVSSASSSMRSAVETSRFGRAITSFEGEAREMDWNFSNEDIHKLLTQYQPLLERVHSLDPQVVVAMRQLYTKNVAAVYGPHVHSLVRCLRDKLPKSSKTHFSKPQALQSWSFHLSSTFFGEALGASALMQQALDHLVPLVLREQKLVTALFFPDDKDSRHEPEDLASVMDGVFDKLLKRLSDFGEAAATRNVLDALALVVLVNGQLEEYRKQSEFLFNTMVSFLLQMKRILIKFTEDQETWINNHHTDTRMAGVLGPIQKTMTMIGRLEESVCGKTDDSTLATIYNRILPATIHWLEKIADSKPKYASLVRLENYYFMSDRLAGINPATDLPLGQYAETARLKYLDSLQRYCAYIWVYEFKNLEPVFASLEELLLTLPASEIQYHTPRQDVRKVIEPLGPAFEKSAKNMHVRMKKHFTASPKTLPMVWQAFATYGKDRLSSYEKTAATCYQLRLEPTPQRGFEVLSKFSSM